MLRLGTVTLWFFAVPFLTPVFAADTTQPAAGDLPSVWRPLWTREPATGRAAVDAGMAREGDPSVRVDYAGQKDWSLAGRQDLSARPGDILEISAWIKIQGSGRACIGAAAYGPDGKVIEWMLGNRSVTGPQDWHRIRSRMVVPTGVARVEPRLIGFEPATVWVQGFVCYKTANVAALRKLDLAEAVTIENPSLAVTLDTRDAALRVEDKRNGHTWSQKAFQPDVVVLDASVNAYEHMEILLHHVPSGLNIKAALQFDPKMVEFTVTLSAEGDLPVPLAWPHPFVTGKGTSLVIPLNEGIAYPIDDDSVEPMRLVGYGGHGICMAFWGVTDGQAAQMAILETPDDAAIDIARGGGLLQVRPQWDPQKGAFGYTRRIRYIFFEQAGHVAMCKRYRDYARQIGLLTTLIEKRKENPSVDLLVGAVNVWCWEKDPLLVIADMKAAGIDRILWSNQASSDDIAAMNRGGILTSRYDIYQDVLDPARLRSLPWIHPDWPEKAWPKDLQLDADGRRLSGWSVEDKDGNTVPCGVVCDKQAIAYAKERIPRDLKDHPYRCRFIDTATAAAWRECYCPDHPMTRSQSRLWRMELLRLVSRDYKLVTGAETGHDAAVPYLHYFEGMMSLGPYRCPDAGRNMQKILEVAPPDVKKFQVGFQYRLPLWELVYHDCVVSYWYWGDYSNKVPAIWDERDLFNTLYGTPAMFMFDWSFWRKNRSRFVQSYNDACRVARATACAEMTDHRFLTPDRTVQQTIFAIGVTVTVNFGLVGYRMPNGTIVRPQSSQITGAAQLPALASQPAGRR